MTPGYDGGRLESGRPNAGLCFANPIRGGQPVISAQARFVMPAESGIQWNMRPAQPDTCKRVGKIPLSE